MKIQKALGLGLCGIFTLMTIGQLGTLWWFQQQLQQQLTTQSGELSKLVLARTAEKLRLVTHNVSMEGQSFVFQTDDQVIETNTGTAQAATSSATTNAAETATAKQAATTATTTTNTEQPTQQRVKVIRLNTPPADGLPGVMQQELEQILVELKTDQPGSGQWVQQFKLERNDSSAQLLQKYLAYQVMALALRKVARLWIPAGPRNFKSCGGKLLNPLLLVALYLCSKIDASSARLIKLSG